MKDLTEELIEGRLKERLKRKPFCVDKTKMIHLNGEFGQVASYFNITKSEDAGRLQSAYSYLTHRARNLSLELTDAPKGERRNIGFVPIEGDELVIVLKVEKIDETERLGSYGIDTYFLHMIRLTVLDILQSHLSRSHVREDLLHVTMWMDEVERGKVNARSRHETGHESKPAKAHCSVNIEGLSDPLPLRDVLAITKYWDSTNKRRAELIEKKVSRKIQPDEDKELQHLQKLAGAKRQLVLPLPITELAEIEADLRRKGVWGHD